mmetsp:Transcript_28423/g.72813  ORF Transcript_28423/g.72813 Transcript_28423/m.72813 type:complete len:242 (+) Transcript_28423:253-978(+)
MHLLQRVNLEKREEEVGWLDDVPTDIEFQLQCNGVARFLEQLADGALPRALACLHWRSRARARASGLLVWHEAHVQPKTVLTLLEQRWRPRGLQRNVCSAGAALGDEDESRLDLHDRNDLGVCERGNTFDGIAHPPLLLGAALEIQVRFWLLGHASQRRAICLRAQIRVPPFNLLCDFGRHTARPASDFHKLLFNAVAQGLCAEPPRVRRRDALEHQRHLALNVDPRLEPWGIVYDEVIGW